MAWGTGAWGTRGWGASTLGLPARAPRPKPSATTEAELRRLWGRDLYFDGDYAVNPAGDWLIVEREEALKQAIIRRIVTAPGEWETLPEYGVGAPIYVKAQKTPALLAELKTRIRVQLLREPRIASVEDVILEDMDTYVKISVKVIPRGQAEHAAPMVASVEVT